MTSKSILMVAFHFPPFFGSSGVQRPISLCSYLPLHGWRTIVLTAKESAYSSIDQKSLQVLPEGQKVWRSLALDATRHLAFKGKYFSLMAIPDRWSSWLLSAVPVALRRLKHDRPSIIWSTYPITTAHLIACALHRITGIPWVADFRDPMVEKNQRTGAWAPADKTLRKVRLFTEKLCVKYASQVVFCTAGAKKIFVDRYGSDCELKAHVIPNGFNEDVFQEAEDSQQSMPEQAGRPFTLLHSGVIYPTPDRDPSALFTALSELASEGVIQKGDFQVILRSTGHDDWIKSLIVKLGCSDFIRIEPACPYKQALQEMLQVDGLLIFQGATSNPAIPAKLYEYIRARRPVFAMTDSQGETAKLVDESGAGINAEITSASDIKAKLQQFLQGVQSGVLKGVDEDKVFSYSRKNRTQEYADLFDSVLSHV